MSGKEQVNELANYLFGFNRYHNCVFRSVSPETNVTMILHVLSVSGPAEADPEYKIIIDANNIIVEIENEISEY